MKKLENWLNSQSPKDVAKLLECLYNQLKNNKLDTFERKELLDFLDHTSKPVFLTALEGEQQRLQWAEVVFKILQLTDFKFKDLFEQRVSEHPGRILFKDMSTDFPAKWTYDQVYKLTRELAALFLKTADFSPRVAIFSQNRIFSAVTDLSCLMFDIFDTPLNIHFTKENLIEIFNRLKINIVVTDTRDRINLLQEVRSHTTEKFTIFTILPSETSPEAKYLLQEAKSIEIDKVYELVSARKRLKNNQVATVMFTSGSTGKPKGVSFSIYNIVSKRFARGAALPFLGDKEVFLCYLPLFHTFGRYLELTGSIYWRGTYTFVGNNSKETLLKLFPIVEPTIFISIPLRWQNLYDKIIKETEKLTSEKLTENEIKKVIGTRFKWGLSAAGYLEPKVFKFFQNYGINLCSGFGMTEATGGITMTPPGKYKENSVGKPLPGVFTRLNELNELEIGGHYIARYLDEKDFGDEIPYPSGDNKDYYLKTGDIFRIDDDGHHYIVDRVKDIYKNNRGQTIAPRVIEQKFADVPGIKYAFLVGDGRPYNVLLIVPDYESTVLKQTKNIEEYFHKIITVANKDVAPYERVVNFAILDRPFSVEKGEFTPKGSFNRKVIEKNFSDIIEKLYKSNTIILDHEKLHIKIPRWFFRDLGILETDIKVFKHGLYNQRSDKKLIIKNLKKENLVLIGDLVYYIEGNTIDLGLIARQPKLWLANTQVINFCPVKEGWDVPLNGISDRVRVPEKYGIFYDESQIPDIRFLKTPILDKLNRIATLALFSPKQKALPYIEELASFLTKYSKEICQVARTRLEALAYSPYEPARVLAYRLLLLADPSPDYQKSFPIFLKSGKTYLTEESIEILASSNIGKQQLQALRQRLYLYRTRLKWDIDSQRRKIFESVFKLLYKFTAKHFEFFPTVRSEFSSWILHKESPDLSKAAANYLTKLIKDFDKFIERKFKNREKDIWKKIMVFGEDVAIEDRERIVKIFKNTFFLEKSLILAFNEFNFSVEKIRKQGLWITKLLTLKDFKHFLISINTIDGKHYDLHMVMTSNPNYEVNLDTQLWMSVISGHPFGSRVVPALGCSDTKNGVLITEYVGGLTVWDKAREYSSIHKAVNYAITEKHWRKLYIKAFSAFLKAWKYSGYKIIPGIISPSNVSVPELDFKQNSMIISLTGWKPYENPLSFISPIIREFYMKVSALYPWTKRLLKTHWIFDAVIETFGYKRSFQVFDEIGKYIKDSDLTDFNNQPLIEILNNYIDKIKREFYFPLALYSAIDQYHEWHKMNPLANSMAKSQTIQELIDLYHLNNYPEIVRFKLYAETYFKDANSLIKEKFKNLLLKMAQNPYSSPLQFIELSELQEAIKSGENLAVFNKMVFPKIKRQQNLQLLKIFEKESSKVLITSKLKDKYGNEYIFRPPISPGEVGQLYQLFYKENYPKEISDNDRLLVLLDKNERVIGGLAYIFIEENIVLLDGMVVISTLQGRGLGSAMIEDFFTRMVSEGVKIIKAHFLFGNYYLKHNFKVDERWGALVRIL